MVLSSCLRGELGINVRYYMILRLTTTVMATATALLLFAVRVEGRTWRLASDGSGDVMYISAAMDSAAVGDTVLVAAGDYEIGPVVFADGIVLISEEGPLRTKLFPLAESKGGLACSCLTRPIVISGFWFDHFDQGGNEGSGAINIFFCFSATIRNCIFSHNDLAGIVISNTRPAVVENCTFVDNVRALHISAGSWGQVSHSILWDSTFGLQSFVVYCNDVLNLQDVPLPYQSGNFSADPQFCMMGDYRITTESPCAPGNSPLGGACSLIGAIPPDCTTTPVESRTWGSIKALYRKQ